MKDVKELGKIKTIAHEGYTFVCFPNSTQSKRALEIANDLKVDGAILGSRIDEKEDIGYTLHFVTHKTTVNVKRLTTLLIEEGKKNDLYWKHNGVQSEKSARVHCANLKLIE